MNVSARGFSSRKSVGGKSFSRKFEFSKKLLAFLQKTVALVFEGNSNQFTLGEKFMLKNLMILIFVSVAAVASVKAQKTDDKAAADETAIRANVEQMMKGWNTKNGADFAKPFAEDADYVVINGMQIKGRGEIAKGHQGIFDTFYKNTTLTLSADSIRLLRPDVAVVHVSSALKNGDGEAARTTNAKITMVMTKANGRWEIAAFQNTQVQAASETKK
jgi:uncharacterized protein (TIGR02246 family)